MVAGKHRVLGIEFLPGYVLWAEVELRGSAPVLRGTGKEAIASSRLGPEGYQEALSNAVSAVYSRVPHSWFDHPDILILFPDSRVTSRYLEVPTDDPGRVREVISFEVTEEIQLPEEEIVWDYLRFGRPGPGTRVLWLATRKSSLDELLGFFGPDLPVARVITPALLGSATLAAPAIREKPDQAAIVIDARPPGATLLVQDAQGVYYARSVSTVASEEEAPTSGSADFVENLSREVSRTLVYARQRFTSLSIKRVLVAGEGSDSLAGELRPPHGVELETLSHVQALCEFDMAEQEAGQVSSEAASLVAAAIRYVTGRNELPNFAPVVSVGAFSRGLQSVGSALGGRFVVVVSLLLALCVGTAVGSSVWRRNAIEDRRAKTSDLLKQISRLKQEEQILRQIQKERVLFSRMFLDFSQKIPENITMSSISLDLKTKFTMKGKAQSNRDVDNIVKILRDTGYFRDVNVDKTAFEKRGFVFYIEGKIGRGR